MSAVVDFKKCPCCAGEDVDLFVFTLNRKNREKKLDSLCTTHLNRVSYRLNSMVKNGEVRYVA